MNNLLSDGTKPRPLTRPGLLNWLNQVSRLNQFCEKVYHRIHLKRQPLIRLSLNQLIPSSGKPTAERICVDNSLALDFKKRWVLLKKGTTPVQQSLHGAGNGDHKRAPSILPTGKEKGVRYSLSKSEGW